MRPIPDGKAGADQRLSLLFVGQSLKTTRGLVAVEKAAPGPSDVTLRTIEHPASLSVIGRTLPVPGLTLSPSSVEIVDGARLCCRWTLRGGYETLASAATLFTAGPCFHDSVHNRLRPFDFAALSFSLEAGRIGRWLGDTAGGPAVTLMDCMYVSWIRICQPQPGRRCIVLAAMRCEFISRSFF